MKKFVKFILYGVALAGIAYIAYAMFIVGYVMYLASKVF